MLLAEAQVPFVVVVVAACILFLVIILQFVVFISVFSPWYQAFISRVPISILEILAMRFRRTDVKAVVKTLVMAREAGVPLSCTEVESACLQGVDLEKITLAYIRATRENMDLTFQDLVDADLNDQLADKLGR